MMSSPRPHERAGRATHPSRACSRGFSLVELLVTIVLAGIIFAAMVPLFVSALKKTGGDNSRVTAMSLAQDRIEKIRQLPYDQISANPTDLTSSPNLYNQSSFGTATPRPFPTTYSALGSAKTYNIAYTVIPHANYKDVNVTVTWLGWGPNYTTSMDTVVMDPSATSVTSTSNPYPTPTAGYTLTVAFKDATQVISPGVTVTYTDALGTKHTPAPTVPETFPFPSKTYQLTWTGLPGGSSTLYTVTCRSSYISSTAPLFHLLTNGWIKFDTHPGGS